LPGQNTGGESHEYPDAELRFSTDLAGTEDVALKLRTSELGA